jgi:glycosyltransferase involved in cell wall biosynthesis
MRKRYLADTLDSALSQTHRDFELIVVDDGSTDGSRAVLERYTDPRVRVIGQSNQGAAAALKAGLRAAQGAKLLYRCYQRRPRVYRSWSRSRLQQQQQHHSRQQRQQRRRRRHQRRRPQAPRR